MQKILELSSALRSIMMFLVLSHTINVCSLIQNHLCSLINYYISANNLQCNLFITVNGTTAERGSTVQAVVLDVAKTERLVDLSLKPEFLDRHKEDSSNSQAGKKVVLKLILLGLSLRYHHSLSTYIYFCLFAHHDIYEQKG